MDRKAIVIGASSGIGREIAIQLAERGAKVAVLARRADLLESIVNSNPTSVKAYRHDVTDFQSIPALFESIVKDLGGLDLIVYCSGVMPSVEPLEFNFEKDESMIDVNFTGAVAWLNEAAHRFAQSRHGSIVAIGSVAGDRGRAGQPVYNATKAALASYVESLRNRLAKLGVAVVTIKPGPTSTAMTEHLEIKGKMETGDVAAFAISKIDKSGEHYVRFTHRAVFAIIRLIPSAIFRRLSI